ncbi:MAG TPA: hypothetical protein PLU22_04390 [Polyangiaceae bacterium]|nr:hypothetical protein [Polyangiaceae bacterium]
MNLLHRLVPPALVALSVGACGGNDSSGCPAGFILCPANNTCVLSVADCGTGPGGGSVLDCGGEMVDTSIDPAHCGACGTVCGDGFVCTAGVCACPAGQTDCGGTCADLDSSAVNCGTCGNACTGGAVCSLGGCTTSGCGAGLTLCGSDCVNLMEHGDHCGACDSPCTGGATCTAGACTGCGAGLTECGTPPTCVNLLVHNSNCGACGVVCSGGSVCENGTCTAPESPCAENQYLCDGTCVNHNGLNCGGCGIACHAGEVCTATGCEGPTVVECDPTNNPTTELCGQWDRLGVGCSEYIYQNNRWNDAAASQSLCATVTGTSFTISSSGLNVSTSGGPAAYTSYFKGCHQTTCSDATKSKLPIQVSALSSATSSWSFSTAGGSFNVSYDLWILPGSGATYSDVSGGTELMIWLDRSGVQPVGSQSATATIDGTSWAVWTGGGYSGAKVISYVRSSATNSVTNLNLKAFIDDAVSRGQASSSNYLKSIEAGFEIWNGGQGMKTNSFSASVN